MIRNYLIILYRNFIRQFSYSLINIIGLSTGLACSMVIFLFVFGEWSYDRGFVKGERIYRIGVSFFNIGKFATGPEKLLNVLPQEFAGIETATRVQKDRNVLIHTNHENFTEPFLYYTDSAYFRVFDYRFVSGDARSILREPHEAVLTRETAERFFGRTNVVGEILEIGKNKEPFKITGVVEKPDFNTHLNTGIWLSGQGQLTGEQAWSSAAFHNYVLLRPTVTSKDLGAALDRTIETHVFPESGKPMGFPDLQSYIKSENAVKFYIHSFRDIYLQSKLNEELTPGGNSGNILIFLSISVFILLLAAVNFVNLTTARASRRAKEVGIRKTMGTSRERLVIQFLTESVLISVFAMLVSLVLAQAFLDLFSTINGAPLISEVVRKPVYILFYFGFSVIVGILSGLYPAFYLTSFLPIRVLKGNLRSDGGKAFRNFLVVFQFSVSIVLIVCTIFVARQLRFMQTSDLGFDQRNVIVVDQAQLLGSSSEAFKNDLLKESGVLQGSFHGGEPGSKRIMIFQTYQTPKMANQITINTYSGDADYCSLMGFHLAKGRFFLKDIASDSLGIVLNEAAVRALDLGDQPIGAVVNKTMHVIGVVSDFHWESLRNTIGPAAILLSPSKWQLAFKVEKSSVPGFLKNAETLWKQRVPDEVFRFHFLDSNFGDLVAKEKLFGNVITFFTLLAVFISCLGLYGLAAFTAEQRTKEIGIRKVLGANTATITMMLNRSFTRLVLLSALIAFPISAWCMSQWLEGFAYKITMDIWTFLLSGFCAFAIAIAAVSYHSFKAAIINPARTLKYE